MGKKRKHLSQAEIWDDSALIRSWDEALEEYKLYHSIHAQGERVEDVLKEFIAQGDREEEEEGKIEEDTHVDSEVGNIANETGDESFEDGELEEDIQKFTHSSVNYDEDPVKQRATPIELSNDAAVSANTLAPSAVHSVPEILVGGVQDEALKNLMMSWYYAGYYTGLYEGQQKVAQGSGQVPLDQVQKGS